MGSFAVNNFGDTRSGGLAGPMGLFVIVLLCIATVLLIRNMNKRLRRLPDSFSTPEQTQREAEIARLNADLDRPAAGTPARNVEQPRSVTPDEGMEDEVTANNTEGDGASADRDERHI
jgi:hypothetical protein